VDKQDIGIIIGLVGIVLTALFFVASAVLALVVAFH